MREIKSPDAWLTATADEQYGVADTVGASAHTRTRNDRRGHDNRPTWLITTSSTPAASG